MTGGETDDYLELVLDAFHNLNGNWCDVYGCTGEGLPEDLFADLRTVLGYTYKNALRQKREDMVQKIRASVDEFMSMAKSDPKAVANEGHRTEWLLQRWGKVLKRLAMS
jgi:hypothetical protein